MKPPKPAPKTPDPEAVFPEDQNAGGIPYRGEKYKRIAAEIGALVDAKNEAYGDSFHECADFLCLLYPYGVHTGQYRDLLALVRIWDKIKRIATHKDAFGENPWQDIAGYAVLMSKDPDPEADFTAADYDDHSGAPK